MKIFLCALVCVVAISVEASNGKDWCELSCGRWKNTMCIYKPQTAMKGCKKIKDSQTPAGRKEMLDLHNKFRDKLASGKIPGWPKAANMRQMSWDTELEEIALRWAMQCKHGHDKCRRSHDFAYVGQNYGMQGQSAEYPSPKNIFDDWVNEISLIKSPNSTINRFQGGSAGHFTQVVWASSFKLGCGEIHAVEGRWLKTIVICNYGPRGNILTTKMYEIGEPCSKCPKGTSCHKDSAYPNLCASHKESQQPEEYE